MEKLREKLFNSRLSAAVRDIQVDDSELERTYSETYQILQHTI